jgi:DNA-binding transcriptional MocR family regulator
MTNWIPDIRDATGPRYKAIVDALEQAIQSKQLHPGQRLPTQRDLAYRLGLSVQTVSRAYAEAERQGLTTGEIGRGTFVQHLRTEHGTGFITDSEQANVLDFSNIMPVVSDLHVEALKEAMTGSSKQAAIQRMLEYRPSQGIAPHRQAGQAWLERNGVAVAAENIIVTNGAAHGIWTAMASVAEPGEVVATEALVDTAIITTASILKVRLRGLALDEEGIVPESFEDACEREPIKLLCITPSFNNPTVSFMGEARREKIAGLARRYDVAIIEDDVFGPLIPNRPKPIWCFAPERTFYVTSFSKAVMPSLRTGYLAGPGSMIPRLVSRLRATGWMANTWTAEVSARWLYDGTADRLIEWQRRKLKARHEILKRVLGTFGCTSHPYAMHAWLSLPEQWRSRHFVEQARSRGLLVTPPDPFVVGRAADPHAVRLALGDTNRDDDNFKRGLERLAALMREDPEPISTHY